MCGVGVYTILVKLKGIKKTALFVGVRGTGKKSTVKDLETTRNGSKLCVIQ